MSKLIIIEGLDGCGKSTQTKLLEEYFTSKGINYKKIKLPDYDSPSSTLVNMYLAGEKIDVDGRIVDGCAEIDMKALTGESIPVTKSAGDEA